MGKLQLVETFNLVIKLKEDFNSKFKDIMEEFNLLILQHHKTQVFIIHWFLNQEEWMQTEYK